MATCCPYHIRKASGHRSAGQNQFYLAIKAQKAEHLVLHTLLNKQHFFCSWVNLALNSSCLCDLVDLGSDKTRATCIRPTCNSPEIWVSVHLELSAQRVQWQQASWVVLQVSVSMLLLHGVCQRG